MAVKLNYLNPIGKKLSWGADNGVIVGVLKDFHFYSMHTAIDPMVIRLGENRRYGTVLVRAEAAKTKEALASLEKLSKDINPKTPFTYQIADEEYARLYSNEQLVSRLADGIAMIEPSEVITNRVSNDVEILFRRINFMQGQERTYKTCDDNN